MKKIGLTGYSGFIGSHIKTYFQNKGFEVIEIKRNNFENLEGLDCIIHLSGKNIADSRWSKTFKKELSSSRIDTTKKLAEKINQLKNPPKAFLVASAVGYYGNKGDEILDESSPKGVGFLSDLTYEWQLATNCIDNNKTRVIFMRFGVVLDKDGGMLKKLTLPFKLYLGASMGSGKQYMSWISLKDLLRAIFFIFENMHISGPVNFTSPYPITNNQFTKALASQLHRFAFLKIPSIFVKMIFGEMGQSLFLDSTRAMPKILLKEGFQFKYPTIEETLKNL